MPFCKYCGTQYPDGGACPNPACPEANKAPESVPAQNPFAQYAQPEQSAQSAQPAKKTSKGVFIALALVVVLIIAAVIVLVLLLGNKKKEEEKKKADSHKAAVETYAESLYDKKGFADGAEITMLDDAFKAYKKSDDYTDDKEDYEDMCEDLEDEDIEISVSRIKKGDELSKKALKAAEEYFDEQADDYDIDDDDITVSEGYEYSIKLKITEDGDTETNTTKVCAVKVKGDGWKIINMDAEDLEYYYYDDDDYYYDDDDNNYTYFKF